MTQSGDHEDGSLFVVATPIGNLEDISLRAIRTLKNVDFIAAEDTRRTRKLLNARDISTPLISLHEHNEKEKSALIIDQIRKGKNVAYVTDAGTPCVSDPGCFLISRAHDENIAVIPIPGPSAVVAALSVSGFPADSFIFCGFMPAQANKRKKCFEELKNEERTIVLYESAKRFLASLKDMLEILGNREIVLAREITKIYEEIRRGKISEFIEAKIGVKIKGEITVIIKPEGKRSAPLSEKEIKEKIIELLKNNGVSLRDAVSEVVRQTGLSRKIIYEIGIKMKK